MTPKNKLTAGKMLSIEMLDDCRIWVKTVGGRPVGFAVSDGEKWGAVLLHGDWVACDSAHEALQYLVANADAFYF